MKVLHLSTQDGGGGAFDSAYRLHGIMKAGGVDSMMAVLRKKTDDSSVICVQDQMTLAERAHYNSSLVYQGIMRRFYGMSDYFYAEPLGFLSPSRLAQIISFNPDVIVSYWIADFMNTETLCGLSENLESPVICLMVDNALMAGGCHYSFDCEGFRAECGSCPQISRFRGTNDISGRQWAVKKACLKKMNLTVLTGSEWQRRRISSASLFREKRIEKIIGGMDMDIFKPADKIEVRKSLGLPVDRKIIFFGATKIMDPRKGYRYLVEALKLLHGMLESDNGSKDSICVVTAGNSIDSEYSIPFEHHHIGYLQGDRQLASAYQAADLFVSSSIEDNGPMMINESILCGTPVVSFDVGVATDLVHNGRTGYRSRLKDSLDLAEGMRRILTADAETVAMMRNECRETGVTLCNPDNLGEYLVGLCNELKGTWRNLT